MRHSGKGHARRIREADILGDSVYTVLGKRDYVYTVYTVDPYLIIQNPSSLDILDFCSLCTEASIGRRTIGAH